jgi:hypothetical protein
MVDASPQSRPSGVFSPQNVPSFAGMKCRAGTSENELQFEREKNMNLGGPAPTHQKTL